MKAICTDALTSCREEKESEKQPTAHIDFEKDKFKWRKVYKMKER